jgi:hypothetical protein
MRLHSVSLETGPTVRLVAEVESERRPSPFQLYFEFPLEYRDFVDVSADSFAVALLVPAMFQGEPLQISPPLSPRLLSNLARIRDIFHAWHPDLTCSSIEATSSAVAETRPTMRAATFFSGGVDSFYTLLKHRREQILPARLTHTIFMRGIEKPLDFARGVDESQRRAEEISAAVGVQCLAGETNIRTYFTPDWLHEYSGSALAATALCLSGGFDYVCIPSTYAYADFVPIGSTPLTDERFSTERLQIVHDGAELPRTDKTARIVEWNRDLVLAHLRVCTLNFGGAYNCCRCWKCVRTTVPLAYLGAFDDAVTFPDKTTTHWEEMLELDSLPFVEEILQFARTHNTRPDLTALLEKVVRRRVFRRSLREALDNSPLRPLLPALLSARRTIRRLGRRTQTPEPAVGR